MKILEYLNPYMWLVKLIGIAALLFTLWYAWGQFTGHYIEIGRAEIRAEWTKQNVVDAAAFTKDLADAREQERQAAIANNATDKKLLEEKLNENKALNIQLDLIRNDNRKLRTVTGQAIRQPQTGQPETGSSTSGDSSTCTVRLPREIDEGFRQLESDVIRIGSEADNAARQLAAANEILAQDRKTCGSK